MSGLLSLLIWLTANPSAACPSGQVYAGGMATSGCNYPAGCYTPERKRQSDDWFFGCWCEEGGVAFYEIGKYGVSRGYRHSQKWINGQCVTKDTWHRRERGKLIEITQAEYDAMGRKPVSRSRRRR